MSRMARVSSASASRWRNPVSSTLTRCSSASVEGRVRVRQSAGSPSQSAEPREASTSKASPVTGRRLTARRSAGASSGAPLQAARRPPAARKASRFSKPSQSSRRRLAKRVFPLRVRTRPTGRASAKAGRKPGTEGGALTATTGSGSGACASTGSGVPDAPALSPPRAPSVRAISRKALRSCGDSVTRTESASASGPPCGVASACGASLVLTSGGGSGGCVGRGASGRKGTTTPE